MDKLTQVTLRRLRQDRYRQTLRNALLNGLVELRLIEWNGAIVRRYSPAFDTSQLTGHRDTDLIWLRRHFSSFLGDLPNTSPSTEPGAGQRTDKVEVLAPMPERVRLLFSRKLEQSAWSVGEEERRAYVLRLVALAGPPPCSGHVITAILVARALRDASLPLADLAALLRRLSFMIVLRSDIAGVQHQIVQLLSSTDLLPSGRFAFGDGAASFSDSQFDFSEAGEGRRLVHFSARHLARLTPRSVRRRLVNAAARDLPVLTTAEGDHAVPEQAMLSADLHMRVASLDFSALNDITEAFHGKDASRELSSQVINFKPRWLTLDDLILAFRPGRTFVDTLQVLACFAAANRQAAIEEGTYTDSEDPDENRAGEGAKPETAPDASEPAADETPGKSGAKRTTTGTENDRHKVTTDPARQTTSRGKRDQPSGAEVIHPEPPERTKIHTARPSLSIETLSGYGKAREWALDLKADLAAYQEQRLTWQDLSSKLLLSGPPGTGKTTFARALCNSLQIPLIVTSVAIWVEGGHLNDVVAKMGKTFKEARELSPSILFIDEVDGIGKRQPAERDYADWWNTLVNKLLELIDGAVRSEGVIVIGATNRPNEIDEAMRRSGRLETHIEIPRPDIPTLAEIFAFHLGDDAKQLLETRHLDSREPERAPGSEDQAREDNNQKGARP